MEIANQPAVHALVRPAQHTDAKVIQRLLTHEFYTHTHVDWYNPLDWLGTPSFMVYEADGEVTACLAITADPAPAAWVRLATLTYSAHPLARLESLLYGAIPHLQAQGVNQILWMSNKRWPDRWLPSLGFERINWLEAYTKEGLAIPPHTPAEVQIRPVLPEDFTVLAQLEARTFEALWRHSARSLHRGWHKALSFDVAWQHGRVVGFQHSVAGPENGAHLARITIDPAVRLFPGKTVAEDVEPEYITLSSDDSTAWVTLQEANAVAVLDTQAMTITAVLPLGTIDHSQPGSGLDASDRDNDTVNIANWPVHGMFMPDAIASYEMNGTTYLVTANEGDDRGEDERIKD
ncbi:MAG: hypothetical protein KDD89_02520, partial [Anaerolineales bacterium]|nr:hypothetical protein [Anaerolineales bacterium]